MSENRDPNLNRGGQTPVSRRRPRQGGPFASEAGGFLSPTKRRKQGHEEPKLCGTPEPVKPAGSIEEEAPPLVCREKHLRGEALLEVFLRLGVRDLVEEAAGACRLWHEVAHSTDLWQVKRAHVRLVDQLLVSEKLVQRRSKGQLFRCRRLGTGSGGPSVLARVVDLEVTNAGKDDGIPTTFLRESALLGKLRHPNVIEYFGSEILGKRAIVCTEFVHENFTQWFQQLEGKSSCERLGDIKVKFGQLLTGLSFLHHRGVMHRNLKPSNIFLDAKGAVKIGDFTATRMLDVPLRPYTPEQPKERASSMREMQRLWYRAPELILREELYGPPVDSWSVGCLLCEAATSGPLFRSESEIDHLFRVFRLVGTPTCATWPEAIGMRSFSPSFPIYRALDFAQVARAVECGGGADEDELLAQAQPERLEVLRNLLRAAAVLGPEGMMLLDRLLAIPPGSRASADAALELPFFSTPAAPRSRASCDLHPATRLWLRGRQPSQQGAAEAEASAAVVASEAAPEGPGRPLGDGCAAPPPAALPVLGSGGCPPVSTPSTLIPSQTVWSILHAMQQQERLERERAGATSRAVTVPLPRLPPGFDAKGRARLIDFIIRLAGSFNLGDYTVHLAASVADKCLAMRDRPIAEEDDDGGHHRALSALGATCLKVADVFAEQSKEYYRQEHAQDYAEATHIVTPEEMLQYEKEALPKLEFDLHLPTTYWFVQCYLAYGRFTQHGKVAKTATLISDLTLLDYDLLAYLPSLRAQCALVLAVFLVQREPGRQPASLASNPLVRGSEALTYLEHWDQHVRNQVCEGNTVHDAAMCLKAVVSTLVERRREWKSMKLIAVEAKHASLARTLVYPQQFPVYPELVRHIVPDRNLLPSGGGGLVR